MDYYAFMHGWGVRAGLGWVGLDWIVRREL
jgi:hypothetical protein